jgi:hypothetical protein
MDLNLLIFGLAVCGLLLYLGYVLLRPERF